MRLRHGPFYGGRGRRDSPDLRKTCTQSQVNLTRGRCYIRVPCLLRRFTALLVLRWQCGENTDEGGAGGRTRTERQNAQQHIKQDDNSAAPTSWSLPGAAESRTEWTSAGPPQAKKRRGTSIHERHAGTAWARQFFSRPTRTGNVGVLRRERGGGLRVAWGNVDLLEVRCFRALPTYVFIRDWCLCSVCSVLTVRSYNGPSCRLRDGTESAGTSQYKFNSTTLYYVALRVHWAVTYAIQTNLPFELFGTCRTDPYSSHPPPSAAPRASFRSTPALPPIAKPRHRPRHQRPRPRDQHHPRPGPGSGPGPRRVLPVPGLQAAPSSLPRGVIFPLMSGGKRCFCLGSLGLYGRRGRHRRRCLYYPSVAIYVPAAVGVADSPQPHRGKGRG